MCFSLYDHPEWRRVVIGNGNDDDFIATSNEEDLLTHEVSDEALEAAGGNEATNFTMAACTFHVGCAG